MLCIKWKLEIKFRALLFGIKKNREARLETFRNINVSNHFNSMKNTPLVDKHIELGAKMVDFAGFNMPVYYEGIKEEHETIRSNVGVFDVSHMGEFLIFGKGALDLVQKVTSNNAAKLGVGDIQYSCLPNLDGGIVDDLLVYRMPDLKTGESSFLLVVNASNIEKDWNWISSQNTFGAEMKNTSDRTGLLAVQGPNAIPILQKLTDVDLSAIKYYNFKIGEFAGIKDVIISATGYTGSGGFELYVNNDDLVKLWDAIFTAGETEGIKPVGLGARDTLRLEMGFCLYGNDISDTTSPIEAGLGWITKTKKGDFNSCEIFKQQRLEGIERKLVGFVMEDRRVPRHDYIIEDANGNQIGIVTSGTQSPSLGVPIGMGYVKKEFSKLENAIYIVAGKKKLKAIITKPPFYKKD